MLVAKKNIGWAGVPMTYIQEGVRQCGRTGSGFFSNQKGSVTALVASTLVPAIGLGAAAFEASHLSDGQDLLDRAAEVALVARIAAERDGVFDPLLAGEDALNRSLRGLGFLRTNYRLREDSGVLVLEAEAEFETELLSYIGVPTYRLQSTAELPPSTRPVAVSFIMDATSSALDGGGGADAVGAFRDMLSFIDQANGEGRVTASLVPMADRVRIATQNRDWLAFDPGADWDGCLEAREERLTGAPFALTAAGPDALPFLANTATDGLYRSGPRRICAPAIVQPTDDFEHLAGTLAGFEPAGQGRFDIGLAWGWRMLSPEWQRPLGVDALGNERRIAVLATDGFSDIYRYEAGGGEADILGYNRGSTVAFQHIADICRRMREDGIELHVIFLSGNDAIEPTLRGCTGTDRRFHEVFSDSDLADAYRAIALDAVRSGA